MKLKKLFKGIEVEFKGSKEIEITGICSDSRVVAPGNLFIAKKGITVDGAKFIPQAIAGGVAAILTDIFDPFEENVVQVIHPDPGSLEGLLASNYYGDPTSHLFMVGITGTNGKTTTSYLVKALLDEIGMASGLIGTIEWIVGKSVFPSSYTSPDVITCNKLLKEMQLVGSKACVMEVSSHALEQNRVALLDYDMAIYTNLTQDHLDYHHTMDAYAEAKRKLFLGLNHKREKQGPKFAIINADCPYSKYMVEGCQARILHYGISQPADLKAEEIEVSLKGLKFLVSYNGEQAVCRSPLIGKYNVYNILAAIAVGLGLGLPLADVVTILSHFKKVTGRLEKVNNALGKMIFVDFAHTEDALKNVLETLRELTKGKIIVVFGCGGNRDQKKRPLMGKVASLYADQVIITSDNPRSEDPQRIADAVYEGCERKEHISIVLDRKEAIGKAIAQAGDKDVVLIAGKGHETVQVFSHQTVEFNDVKVAKEVCETIASNVTC